MQASLGAILYVSELADGHDASCVGSILSTARALNALHGETGVLVFDGERFCQYVEGDISKLQTLRTNLLHDQRHKNFIVLADVPIEQRAFDQFRMGYTDMEDVDALGAIAATRGHEAVASFLALASRCDVQT